MELGFRGAIQVNAQLQTSDPAIYAVGDAIQVKDRNHGFATMVSLAWGANRQGRLVADHMNGQAISYDGALGTSVIKTFALTAASTGNNEKTLLRLGVPYKAVHIHPASHAGYYPGASPISMKLLFNPETGMIYGAQAVGVDGVDKRIDVIATAIRGHLEVCELADIELAYAPPYSSVKILSIWLVMWLRISWMGWSKRCNGMKSMIFTAQAALLLMSGMRWSCKQESFRALSIFLWQS